MSRVNEQEQQCLILNISHGSRFNCLKNVLLRVSAIFENERLTSDYVLCSPAPFFNMNFVWWTTSQHMKETQKSNNNIQIDISATNSGQTWIAGRATLGIQHAQVMGPNTVLNCHHLPLYSMRPITPVVLRPQLLVTLSIRSEPLRDLGCRLYSANHSETSKPLSPRGRVTQPTTSTLSPTTTERGEYSQRYWDPISECHRYHKEKIEKDRIGSSKSEDHRKITFYSGKCSNEDDKLVRHIEKLRHSKNPSVTHEGTFSPVYKTHIDQNKQMNKKTTEPLDYSNNDIEMTSGTSSTETTTEPKAGVQKARILPDEMGILSKVCSTIQNIDRNRMKPGFSKSHDCTPAMQKNSDEPSTSSLPSAQDIFKNETEAPIAMYAAGSINLIDNIFDARNKKMQMEKSHDQTTAASILATYIRSMSAPPSFARRRFGAPPSSPVRTILAHSSRSRVKVKKTVRFKEDADIKKY